MIFFKLCLCVLQHKNFSGKTLSEAGYSDWGSGSPSGGTDQCGALSQHTGTPRGFFQLKDVPCTSSKLLFMCEQNILNPEKDPSAIKACTDCGTYDPGTNTLSLYYYFIAHYPFSHVSPYFYDHSPVALMRLNWIVIGCLAISPHSKMWYLRYMSLFPIEDKSF